MFPKKLAQEGRQLQQRTRPSFVLSKSYIPSKLGCFLWWYSATQVPCQKYYKPFQLYTPQITHSIKNGIFLEVDVIRVILATVTMRMYIAICTDTVPSTLYFVHRLNELGSVECNNSSLPFDISYSTNQRSLNVVLCYVANK